MEAREIESCVNRQLESFAERYLAPAPEPIGPTFGEFFKRYMSDHAEIHTKSANHFEGIWRLYLSAWADKPMKSVTKADIAELQAKITRERSPGRATKTVELISILYNKAVEWEILAKNPAYKMRKFKHQPRERFLQEDELKRFFEAVFSLKNTITRDVFLMLLFTGQRRRNVCEMTWRDLDLNRAAWRIPMTKNGTSHMVPLVPIAVDILRRRATFEDKHPVWVFPRMDNTGPIWARHIAWKFLCQRAGLENLRIHDLRRSLASWQAITGASLPIIGQTLNHKEARSTQIYARLNLSSVRTAMEKAVNEITKDADLSFAECPVPPIYVEVVADPPLALPLMEDRDEEDDQEEPGVIKVRPCGKDEPRVNWGRPKNADIKVKPHQQRNIEGKILDCLTGGRNDRTAFYNKIGGQYQVNRHELLRILGEMEERGLLHAYPDKPARGQTKTRYAPGPRPALTVSMLFDSQMSGGSKHPSSKES